MLTGLKTQITQETYWLKTYLDKRTVPTSKTSTICGKSNFQFKKKVVKLGIARYYQQKN